MVTFGSLFSGIGGMDLGLQRAGMSCLWQVEIDDYCQKVLTKHWPDVPCHYDIKTLEIDTELDILTGGFPCQPFSVAGKKNGKDELKALVEILKRDFPDYAHTIKIQDYPFRSLRFDIPTKLVTDYVAQNKQDEFKNLHVALITTTRLPLHQTNT